MTIRKMLTNAAQKLGIRRSMSGAVSVGTKRAGMHQAAEHEFKRALMADGVPEPETVENALDLPAALDAEIPETEEIDEAEAEEIAAEAVEIVPDPEILEEVADPAPEEPEEEPIVDQMAVDYSGERIPEIEPLAVTGSVEPETPLEYNPGDGSLKEIQEPLPGLGEKYGVMPLVDGLEPVRNVAALPEE